MSTALLAPDDGRRLRGDASRRRILDAATEVIAERGVASVTHRAVAEAAGVPLARVSYHYPRVDDLLVAAARQYLAGFDARLVTMAASARVGEQPVVDACTDFLHELVTTGARDFLAVVEIRLALHARGLTVEDTAVLEVVQSFGADDTSAAAIVAAMFGFAVLAATSPAPVPRTQVRDLVATVLGMAS
ncbi:MAG: TetR family transcriptional regulator [Acidimicrobiia bacterium]|nr:TetR family transcriptional regulator [Acidimicrobiia bacterium]